MTERQVRAVEAVIFVVAILAGVLIPHL